MALTDILKLADDKLAETFAKRAVDPAKARKPILKMIDNAINQFASATPVKGRKMWKEANGVVEFTPPFQIGGKDMLYIPSERFGDVLKTLRASVEAGEADDAIKARAEAGAAPAATGAKRSDAGKKRGPLSPEALAARRAKMAAKK